jgi:hypothetical protein
MTDTSLISATWKVYVGRSWSSAILRKSKTLSKKKKGLGEWLKCYSKHKALSSNPSITEIITFNNILSVVFYNLKNKVTN